MSRHFSLSILFSIWSAAAGAWATAATPTTGLAQPAVADSAPVASLDAATHSVRGAGTTVLRGALRPVVVVAVGMPAGLRVNNAAKVERDFADGKGNAAPTRSRTRNQCRWIRRWLGRSLRGYQGRRCRRRPDWPRVRRYRRANRRQHRRARQRRWQLLRRRMGWAERSRGGSRCRSRRAVRRRHEHQSPPGRHGCEAICRQSLAPGQKRDQGLGVVSGFHERPDTTPSTGRP